MLVSHLTRAARALGAAALAGALGGLLAGGLLGRAAMRLLALTSPDSAHDRFTDDGALVGAITLDGTLGLASFLVTAGAVLGPAYLIARRVLPHRRRWRVAAYALLAGLVGGALFVHDETSFDYTELSPTWLAVLLFVAVPGAYGAVVALVTDALAPRADPPAPRSAVGRLWESSVVTRAGTVAYWVLVAWGAYNLGVDVVSLVGDEPATAPFTI